MNQTTRFSLIGAGLGAGTMFLLDPARGARRRAVVRDKFVRAARKTRDAAGATRRDVRNRLRGTTSEMRARLSSDATDDWTLCERVRAELGRIASHPRAITVSAERGIVTLSGDVLDPEAAAIVRAVSRVRGVEDVYDRMTRRTSAARIPSLQGGSSRPDQWGNWMAQGWSPTAMLVTALGATLAGVAAMVTARRAA